MNKLLGVLMLCCSAFAGESVVRNGTQIVEKAAIATTTTDGIAIVNPTPATVGVPVQYSPRTRWRGQVWDTDGSNDVYDWWSEVVPTSGANTLGPLNFYVSKNSAAGTLALSIAASGTITGSAAIIAGTTVQGASVAATGAALTTGTFSATSISFLRTATHKYSWTNAMVVALGATTSGDITVCTLPAKVRVISCLLFINTAGTNMGAATFTVQVGTDATFSNFLNAGSGLAAANTLYGDADSEMGGSLPPTQHVPFLPSWTATTAVKMRCITDGAGGKTLADVLTSTGSIYLVTETLP